MRPLQVKRKEQLESLGFPVFCVDRFEQIRPVLDAIASWQPENTCPMSARRYQVWSVSNTQSSGR
jgi:hypothetical protein